MIGIQCMFQLVKILYIDNFYSYELTMSCLSRKTHIIRTSKNKKFISKSILHCKLRKAEMISKENDNGIMGIMGCHTQMEKRYTRCENFIHETRFHHGTKYKKHSQHSCYFYNNHP